MWFATMGKKLNKAAEKGDNVNVRELLKKATAKELNWQNEVCRPVILFFSLVFCTIAFQQCLLKTL